MTLTRRALMGTAFPLLPIVAGGCAPTLPSGLRTPQLPDENAAVFQALLSGKPVPPLDADARWQVAADAPGSVTVAGDALCLSCPSSARAWASPRLPLTPLTGERRGQVEELTWDTEIDLRERFFVVCELRFAGESGAILIQSTPFDVQVFQDALRPEGGRSESLSRLVGDGKTHFWRLRLAATETQLHLNGSPIWSLPGAHALSRVAFGETRADAQHSGVLLLRNVVYVRRPI